MLSSPLFFFYRSRNFIELDQVGQLRLRLANLFSNLRLTEPSDDLAFCDLLAAAEGQLDELPGCVRLQDP